MDTKLCLKCKTSKPLSDFYCRPNGVRSSPCKECQSLAKKQRYAQQTRDRPPKFRRYAAPPGIGESQKLCSKCGIVKEKDDFYSKESGFDDLSRWCKSCFLSYCIKRYDKKRQENPSPYSRKTRFVCNDYFLIIDEPIKAYILGFLAADGNVLMPHYRVTVEIAQRDEALLGIIRDQLLPGAVIRCRTRTDRSTNHHSVVLTFSSAQLVNDLATYGVVPAKSSVLQWPERLPEMYLREFVLGYFDGDGTALWSRGDNKKYAIIEIVSGSEGFLSRLIAVVEQKTGVRMNGPRLKQRNVRSSTYSARISGKRALELDAWLHSSGLGLERKSLAAKMPQPD